MDYTLKVLFADGETRNISCATDTEVENWMVSIMREQFAAGQTRVLFQILNHTKEKV